MATLVLAIHIIICVFLILIILIQPSKEGGLGGLFSGESGQPLFGPRSGDIMTRITSVLAIGFMITSITLTVISARRPRQVIDKILTEETTQFPPTAVPVTPMNTNQEENDSSSSLP